MYTYSFESLIEEPWLILDRVRSQVSANNLEFVTIPEASTPDEAYKVLTDHRLITLKDNRRPIDLMVMGREVYQLFVGNLLSQDQESEEKPPPNKFLMVSNPVRYELVQMGIILVVFGMTTVTDAFKIPEDRFIPPWGLWMGFSKDVVRGFC